MTLDDLCERADELGIRTDTPLVVHEPGEGFYTIEELTVTEYGQLRVVIQPTDGDALARPLDRLYTQEV